MEPPGTPPPSAGAEPGASSWATEAPKSAKSRTPLFTAVIAVASLFFLVVGLFVGYVIFDDGGSDAGTEESASATKPDPVLPTSCEDALASASLAFDSFDDFYGLTETDFGEFGALLDAAAGIDEGAYEARLDQATSTLAELEDWEFEFYADWERCGEDVERLADQDRGGGDSG